MAIILLKPKNHYGRGNKGPRVTCQCGYCGKDIILLPSVFKKRLASSKSGKLYHEECYDKHVNGNDKKLPPLPRPGSKERPLQIRGDKERGFTLAIPAKAQKFKLYTCDILGNGILVYTPIEQCPVMA